MAHRQLTPHVFAWSTDMQRASLKRNALYLIRPDRWIA